MDEESRNGHSSQEDRDMVDNLLKISDPATLRQKLLDLVTEVRTLKERVTELELQGNEDFCIETCPMDVIDLEDQKSSSIEYNKESDHQVLSVSKTTEDAIPKTKVPGNKCWNCDSEGHSLRECKEKRNPVKININRQLHAKNSPKLSNTRYHVDEPQRFGHLKPGLPSKKLRKALGLHDDQIPAYIYKMRSLGYPPGWLKEAEINHSNMALYVEQDKALPDHGDEDGEISGDKTQYDVDKIQEWPGFNIECDFEHVFTDESDYYRAGPMRSDQSKEAFVSNIGVENIQSLLALILLLPTSLRFRFGTLTFICTSNVLGSKF